MGRLLEAWEGQDPSTRLALSASLTKGENHTNQYQ